MDRGNKAQEIRELLLKTIGKSPELFCYYASIQQARELLGKAHENLSEDIQDLKPIRKVTEC